MSAAVFIDGAYLSKVLKKHFGSPRVDHHSLVAWACGDEQLFRAYYYDCLPYQSARPTDEERQRVSDKQKFFLALERGQRFTVRQGRLEYRGTDDRGSPVFTQKRVDLKLGLDVASLVATGRVAMVVLIAGDSDFIPVVEFAKQQGVIVRLIHGPSATYHTDLWTAVDERKEITEEVLQDMLL